MEEQTKKVDEISPVIQRTESYGEGLALKLDNKEIRDFYGNSITDSYRLKSELVGKCLEEIGMGRLVDTKAQFYCRCSLYDLPDADASTCNRYQWELFVVTGFGWITDNL